MGLIDGRFGHIYRRKYLHLPLRHIVFGDSELAKSLHIRLRFIIHMVRQIK
jgi:hypothetical protein